MGAAAPITGALAAAMDAARQVQLVPQASQHGAPWADTTGTGPPNASQGIFPGPLTQGTFPGPLAVPGSVALQQALQKRLREQLAAAVAADKQPLNGAPLDAQLLLMQAAGAQGDALASFGAFKVGCKLQGLVYASAGHAIAQYRLLFYRSPQAELPWSGKYAGPPGQGTLHLP